MAVVLMRSASGKLVETPVGDRVVIGRGSACGLRLDDDLVSRRHAEIVRIGEDFVLRDLASRNGTRLNGVPATAARLLAGDTITIGRVRLLFSDHAPSELVGSTLGGYEVLEQIGSGGMGIVYRARQVTLQRIVALKVLHPRLVAQRKFIDRFLREARAAGALDHPNLLHVQDAGHSGETYYYAMEFVDGQSVAEALRHGPLRPARATDIALQIASALAYIHHQGMVHRDVKPGNIMVAADGTAKLADLGLARSIELPDPDAQPGPDGRPRIWGTPAYVAPEVAVGRPAEPRSDLYGLGATLFHMLTGRAPYAGADTAEILTQHVTAAVPEVQSLAPDVPRALKAVVEKLLAKRPRDRYASGDALVEALRGVLGTLQQATSEAETRSLSRPPPAGSP